MIAFLGHLSVVCALLTAMAGAVAAFAGTRERYRSLVALGRHAAFAVLGFVVLATGLMEFALVTHDFSVQYVAQVGNRSTPLYYTVISLWAALEGSILFWVLLLSVYTAVFLVIYRRRFSPLQPYVTGILLSISSFFLFVIAFPGNPFSRMDPVPADGPGPNVLLQNHWIMGIHPPMLYLGYVGLALPYAIAMSSLLTRDSGPATLQLIRRWALIPWVFLSVGIIMGMWWSYAVLGWGGYWSWDPVENVSVMPWLVTTAFLHSLQVQERRRMLKTWTLSLVVAAFLLTIVGTFITRSGVLQSVHAFSQSTIGLLFLAFFALLLVGSLGVLFLCSRELDAPGALESAVCRETVFLLNNLLLVGMTFTVLLGTVFPLIAEAVQGSRLSVGAPYFNQVSVPMGLAILFLMGVGPALPWGMARLDDLQYRFLVPVASGVAAILLLLLLGVRGIGPLVTFGLSMFVLAVTLWRWMADVQVRRRNTGEGWATALRHLVRANPRRYGGLVAHLGVLLIVIGIAASQAYSTQTLRTVRPGQTVALGDYRITYTGLRAKGEPNRMVLAAEVRARRGSRDLGTLLPSLNVYPDREQPVATPAVREQPLDMVAGIAQGRSPLPQLGQLLERKNPFEDLYIVLQGVETADVSGKGSGARAVTLEVRVNPMVGLIWLGGLVVGLGGVYALLPARRRRRVLMQAAEAVRLQPEEVIA